MSEFKGATVVFEAEPGDDYLHFQPVKLSQRIAAAAMAIAFVPILAAVLRFVLHLSFVQFVDSQVPLWNNPLWMTLTALLSITMGSFVFSWIGFLFLVPITHRNRPERYLRQWWRIPVVGAVIGGCMGALLSILLLALGAGEASLYILGLCAGYGAFFAFVYWVLLRWIYVRRIPPVEDVFA